MSNLNKEELELLESVENGEWKSVEKEDSKIAKYQQMAQRQFTNSISIKLSEKEHYSLKKIADNIDQSSI